MSEMALTFNGLVSDNWFSEDSTLIPVKLSAAFNAARQAINETIETIKNGPDTIKKHVYKTKEDFKQGLENITRKALDSTAFDDALKAGHLVAEQSELLYDLVNGAHENGFDPDDPETAKAIDRVTKIEETLGTILREHPEITQDTALRVAFGGGKSGEFVAKNLVGGALIASTGWSGIGAVAGTISTAYGTNLSYEIGYGDKIRELLFTKGIKHYGSDLRDILARPVDVEKLDETATKKGLISGGLSITGTLLPLGAGKLASIGIQRLTWGIMRETTKSSTMTFANMLGVAAGQAALTGLVTGDPELAAASVLIPSPIAFIPRSAPKEAKEGQATSPAQLFNPNPF